MKTTRTTLLAFSVVYLPFAANAAVIGMDAFDYADGSIAGQNGGTGWNTAGGVAAWTGSATVSGGTLISGGHNGGFRNYGGNEFDSAVQATGQIFFRVEVTTGNELPAYFGISSFDFGTERYFFGRTFNNNFGLDAGGGQTTLTGVAPTIDTTYLLIGVIDYENDQTAFFLNPTGSDFYNPDNGATSSTTTREYTATNWSSGIRLQAGDGPDGSAVAWDNVVVGTSPLDVGLAIPEPSSLMLCSSLAALVAFRRKRS